MGSLTRGLTIVISFIGAVAVGGWWLYLRNVGEASDRPKPPPVMKKSCDFTSQYGFQVDCYWILASGEEARATLSAAVFRSSGQQNADPLIYVAGGPGESGNTSAEILEIWDEWLSRQSFGRDFVLLDLRGLASSKPVWQCEEYETVSKELLQRNLTFTEEGELMIPVLEKCLSSWESELIKQGGPVSRISELHSLRYAEDLALALRHLGYQEWNYLAVSYGTRVALLSAILHKEVRRVILDSPYPFSTGVLSDGITLWADAFREFWDGCEKAVCEFDEAQFWDLMVHLREHPEWVDVEDWRSGRQFRWLLNDGRLAAALYTAMYSSELRGEIAPALAEYKRGDRPRLFRLLEVFYNQAFDSRFNSAIYWAVECNDNPLESEESFKTALEQTGLWRSYFETEWQFNICRSPHFQNGQLPAMRKLSIPVLNAVGTFDPITTKQQARSLMEWLEQGYLLEQEGASHAEFFAGDCGQQLISWFLNSNEKRLRQEWEYKAKQCQRLSDF